MQRFKCVEWFVAFQLFFCKPQSFYQQKKSMKLLLLSEMVNIKHVGSLYGSYKYLFLVLFERFQ